MEPESEPSSELDSSNIQDISSLITEPYDNPESPSLITGQCSNPDKDSADDLSKSNGTKEIHQKEGTEKSCIGGNGEVVEPVQTFNDPSISYNNELGQKGNNADNQVPEVTPGNDKNIDSENNSNTGSEHLLSSLRPNKNKDKLNPIPNYLFVAYINPK